MTQENAIMELLEMYASENGIAHVRYMNCKEDGKIYDTLEMMMPYNIEDFTSLVETFQKYGFPITYEMEDGKLFIDYCIKSW